MLEKINPAESKAEKKEKAADCLKKILKSRLIVNEKPSQGLAEETIFVDSKLEGQLVIPRYANDQTSSEIILH